MKQIYLVLLIVYIYLGILSACPKSPITRANYPVKTYQIQEPIFFNAADSYDRDSYNGGITPKWIWDFDYNSNLGFIPNATVTDPTIEWSYDQPAIYRVAVQYVDNDGQYGNIYFMTVTIGIPIFEVSYTYNNADQIKNYLLNSIQTLPQGGYSYDARGRILDIDLQENNLSKYHEHLGYESNGNINYQNINANYSNYSPCVNALFAYDNINRLTDVTYNRNEHFTYDNDGNILTKSCDDNNISYQYGNNNDQVTSIFSNSNFYFEYNARGSVISDTRKAISLIQYNYNNLPTLLHQTNGNEYTYGYDNTGNRTYKKVTTGSTIINEEYYLRDQTGRELAIYDVQTKMLKMLNLYGSSLIGRVNVSWEAYTPNEQENNTNHIEPVYYRPHYEKYYYVKDHLGNINLTLSENGSIVNGQLYLSYGEYISGTNYSEGGIANDKYKFTGKERDNETGYDYFGSRFYDSQLGRWLSVDPLADKYPGWSPYNYCLNNPIKLIDDDGRGPKIHLVTLLGGTYADGFGGGASIAYVYNDRGNAAILLSLVVGGGGGGMTRYASGGQEFEGSDLNDLQGLGLSGSFGLGGAKFGASADFNLSLHGFNNWGYTLGNISGAAVLVGISYSKLLLEKELTELKAKFGNGINITYKDGKIIVSDNKNKQIASFNLENKIVPLKGEKNKDGFYTMPSDNTQSINMRNAGDIYRNIGKLLELGWKFE
jgi:RHS repeat-associated protein